MTGDVAGFYAALGVELPPVNGASNVAVACFTNPQGHAHDDKSKSASVSVVNGAFNCHGCEAKGGAYDAALALGKQPPDAMALLTQYGLVRDEGRANGAGLQSSRTIPVPKPSVTEAQINEWQKALLGNDGALAKLEELRGWSSGAIERLGIGVDRDYRHPTGGGSITLPTRGPDGALTGCVHYAPDPAKRSGSKSIAKGPRQLFPAPETIEDNTVWLVEGEPDAVTAHSIGLPAVAVPGVESWKDAWASRFSHFSKVIVCVDDDEPGKRLTAKLSEALSPVVGVAVLDIGPFAGDDRRGVGFDLTDLALSARSNGGLAHLRKVLRKAADTEPATRATQNVEPAPLDGEWPALNAHVLPEFPTDALPGAMSAWVEAVAEESQTPEDLAALAALGVLSGAAMGSAVVDCGAWEEELGLYVLVAMPSGDRKSTVLKSAAAPLRALESEHRDTVAPEIRTKRNRKQVLERSEQKLIKSCSEADNETRSGLEGELTLVTTELAEIGEPVLPRLLADDATPEALGHLLAKHGSIAVVAAESALLDNLGGRYSEGAANLHLVCSAYGGESTTIDRRGRDPEELLRPLMTIALAVQPHVLDRLVSHEIARSQGLVARFAYSMPTTQLGRRKIDADRTSAAIRDGWASVVRRVFELPKEHDKNDKTPNSPSSVISVMAFQGARITLAKESKARLDALRTEQEPRLSETGDLRPVADWVARHPGRVARIAGLLHLAEHAINEPISEKTMRNALRIGDYLLSHGIAALTEKDPLIRRAVRWLTARSERTVSQRDLQRGPGQAGDAEDAALLAADLERFGVLRSLPDDAPANAGRPPSPTYEVHPELGPSSVSSWR